MKHKILAFFLAMLMLFSMAACQKKQPSTNGTEGSSSTPVPVTLVLAENGTTSYGVVRADNASGEVVKAASALRSALAEQCGVDIRIYDEYSFLNDSNCKKIAVGRLDSDDISKEIAGELLQKDYTIRIRDDALYIIGGSDKATAEAVNAFIASFLQEKTDVLTLSADMLPSHKGEYAISSLSISGNPVSSYRIVYEEALYWSKQNAVTLRDWIAENNGVYLPVVGDSNAETDFEIVVGNADRPQTKALTENYETPNLFYDVKFSGNKLLIVGQGARSVTSATEELIRKLERSQGAELNLDDSFALSGNLSDIGGTAREEKTDLRVMTSNILFVTTPDNDNGYTDQMRGELLADLYLMYMPDIISFNEYAGEVAATLKRLIAPYYTFTDSVYEDTTKIPDDATQMLKAHQHATPIAYRTGKYTEVASGYRYIGDLMWAHSITWAVLQDKNGNRFVTCSNHYGDQKVYDANGKNLGRINTTFAEATMNCIKEVKAQFGDIPVIITGDFFFQKGDKPYQIFIENGYVDGSETAENKYSDGRGTYHKLGEGITSGIEEDILFHTPEWLTALGHRIVVSKYSANASDHYPVYCDYQWKKASSDVGLPEFSDNEAVFGFDEFFT